MVEKQKILIIDDEEITRKILEVMLKNKGYEVLSADGAAQGLEAAFNDHPDLIILDVYMPNMDGWEVLAQLRFNKATRLTPVLMVTKADTIRSVTLAHELGATAYLTKPIQSVRLIKKVTELLRHQEGPNAIQ